GLPTSWRRNRRARPRSSSASKTTTRGSDGGSKPWAQSRASIGDGSPELGLWGWNRLVWPKRCDSPRRRLPSSVSTASTTISTPSIGATSSRRRRRRHDDGHRDGNREGVPPGERLAGGRRQGTGRSP